MDANRFSAAAAIGAGLLVAAGLAIGSGAGERSTRAASDPLYLDECGSCHLAYPPGLLPARSWRALMAGLDDHFGDNAELDEISRRQISTYLEENASRGSRDAGDTRLRITETRHFRHEHDEIPTRLVADNAEVGSFSRCDACHADADRGHFDEDTVRIPGHGRWDD